MKAYFVLDITVHDFGRFKTYIDAIPAIIERHHGRDPEAKKLFTVRHATTTGRLLLADGCT